MTSIIEKSLAAITSIAATDDYPFGGFEAIASAPTVDRDGDVFSTDEWKTPLPEHITIDIDHEMSVAGTIGSAVPYIADDGTLRIKATFSSIPRAQEVRTLMQEGHIRTVSVACMTDRELKNAGSPCRELLNVAVVGIPSNREAVVTSVKSGARNSKADQEHIQAVHDHAAALGAQCSGEADGSDAETDTEPDDSGSGSSDGANKTLRREIVVGKALTGSVEDLRSRINTALSQVYAELDNGYPWLLATFLNADGTSGTIVYELDGSDNGDVQLGRDFTDDGATITLADEFAQVQIIQSVQQSGPMTNVDLDSDQDGDFDADKPLAALRSAALDKFDREVEQKTSGAQKGDGQAEDDEDADASDADSDADDAEAAKAAPAADAADSAADTDDDESDEANTKRAARIDMVLAALT